MFFRKCLFVSLCLLALSHTTHAQGLSHDWSKRFGDAVAQFASGVAVDASGNVVVTGGACGTVDFGGGPLSSAGANDIFVVKFGPSGSHLWSKRFGDADDQGGHGVAVDASGNVIVTGGFDGTVNFGGGPLSCVGDPDIFVAKFDPNGNHLWSKRFGDADRQDGFSIAVDASGNVIVTGWFDGTVNFGGGPLTSLGFEDIFVVKFDPNGNHLWSKRFGDADPQYAESVTVDASGNVVVTGDFWGTVDFDGGPLNSAGKFDIFVVKFDPNGNHLWSKRFGDADWQFGFGIAVDASGKVIVTGNFWGTVDFGGGPLSSAGDSDIFVAKFDPNGNHLWSKRFGDADRQDAFSIAVDPRGDVIVTGYLWGTVDFGGGPFSSAGDSDIFVVGFHPNGTYLSGERFGDAGAQWYIGFLGIDVAVDVSGNVIVAGSYWNTVDFGGGQLTSAGDSDIFIVEFADVGTGIFSIPIGTALRLDAHPNPFNPQTVITYFVPNAAPVNLRIYDVEGRLIQTLVTEGKSFGEHTVMWDGRDGSGEAVSSGIYFVRLESAGQVQTRKIALIK